MGSKKHKKHKKDRTEDKPGLKLILKVGGSSTPEHSIDSPLASNYSLTQTTGDEESMHSVASFQQIRHEDIFLDKQHKKMKKKKKKKDKDKDKEKDKHDKKRKHHKRKKLKDESSQDDVSIGDESLLEPPTKRPVAVDLDHSGFDLLDPQFGEGSPSSRGSRMCVLRQRQEKTPFQKFLDHIHRCLEKRDAQQFFAWPVTDNIAPGYSAIISHPMDFSTMKQKIDDDMYSNLTEYIEDFKLMCGNAMVYNHPDTIYFKAAKRLLHAGVKLTHPDKLRPLRSLLSFMSEIPKQQLGFDLGSEESDIDTEKENMSIDTHEKEDSKPNVNLKPVRRGPNYLPESKFEAIPDDLTPEELLKQCTKAAADTAEKLACKKPNTKMGFMRQSKDGSTSLAIIVPNNGIDPETNERPISLGALIGKLNHGSGSLQGFREDRRNLTKTVKPLYYGAFGSYAPSYDSTFANLSKEETDLIYQTYGDETSVQYAESILNFAKDSDYTLTMVDNLLDLLTGGEHRKTKKVLDEKRKFREEEENIKQLMESKPTPANSNSSGVKVEMSQLKTLSEIGIDTSFLNSFEGNYDVQERLDKTTGLIERLQQVQNERLSATPPPHLSHVTPPNETELALAEKITSSLTDLAKRVAPSAIASVPGVRKAMGIAIEPPIRSTDSIDRPESAQANESTQTQGSGTNSICITVEGTGDVAVGVDLESELREFLESDPALTSFPLHDDDDDNTIEQMLSES